MEELRYESRGVQGVSQRRPETNKPRYMQPRGAATQMKAVFYNVSVLCGTAIVVAITVKVIMSLFS